jgi:hypothetical protein
MAQNKVVAQSKVAAQNKIVAQNKLAVAKTAASGANFTTDNGDDAEFRSEGVERSHSRAVKFALPAKASCPSSANGASLQKEYSVAAELKPRSARLCATERRN